jgi:hypothetical protein
MATLNHIRAEIFEMIMDLDADDVIAIHGIVRNIAFAKKMKEMRCTENKTITTIQEPKMVP